MFLDTSRNFSKLSKIIFDIVLISKTKVCKASHSVLEHIGYGYIRYSGIPVTSCFAGCIVSEPTLRYIHTMPCGTQRRSVARLRGKSCAMPQVYVDVASDWLRHAV